MENPHWPGVSYAPRTLESSSRLRYERPRSNSNREVAGRNEGEEERRRRCIALDDV